MIANRAPFLLIGLVLAALLSPGSTRVRAQQPPAANRLDGLYVGLVTGPQLMPGSSREDYRVFFPDGTWLWRLPQEGLENFDAARYRREFPSFWGTYRVSGAQVILRLDEGSSETIAQRDRNGGLNIPGRAVLFPVAKLTGQRFAGEYAREAGAFPPIVFRADGTFEDRGALSAVGLAGPDMMFMNVPPGRGEYRIADNTLTLRYADGRVLRVVVFVPERGFSGQTPRAIVLNSYSLGLIGR